jgi:hypothetical protein
MSRKRWSFVVFGAIGFLLLLLFFPCIQRIRDGERYAYSVYNMRQIGYAIQSYHDANGHLPPAVVRDKEGRPLYSWRVLILPYIEEAHLYEKFKYDEPWDSPHNLPLSQLTPRCYIPPFGEKDPDITRYQVFIGPGTAFERPALTLDDFPDGLENTILVVESSEPVIWSKPVDLTFDPDKPLPGLGSGISKPIRFLCRDVGRRPGFAAAFGDGSVRFIRSSTEEIHIRAIITRNGGEKVDVSSLE